MTFKVQKLKFQSAIIALWMSWLVSINMLRVIKINNKNINEVTDSGIDLGSTEEERMGQYGKYFAVTYDKNAQQFVGDNLNAIVDGGFN